MARNIRYSEASLKQFPRLLLPKEAAQALCVTEHTLAGWRSSGDFGPKYVKVGRLIRYTAGDIADFIKSRSVAPRSKPPIRAARKNEGLGRQTAKTA
jgi:predicted DNA-binding transcriptional regulator AlpA